MQDDWKKDLTFVDDSFLECLIYVWELGDVHGSTAAHKITVFLIVAIHTATEASSVAGYV